MASSNDIKFYLGGASGLGGTVSGTQVISTTSNNLFPNATASERSAGVHQYKCIYMKNTGSDTMNDFFLWLASVDTTNRTLWQFGRDQAGKNGTAQTIANINTAPTSVTWRNVSEVPVEPITPQMKPNDLLPLWVHRQVIATTVGDHKFGVADDPAIFNFAFRIAAGGTGDTGGGGTGGGGGGTGGNPPPAIVNWRMIVIGDEGCETETDDVIALVQRLITEAGQQNTLLVSVGDHAYASPTCWTNRFTVLKNANPQLTFLSAYGNHEYSESGGVAPYKTFFNRSDTWFEASFQNAYLLFIDTNKSITSGTQSTFVNTALANIPAHPQYEWKIAVMHHPWFVIGSRNAANEFDQIETFHQDFNDSDIDLVLTGHNHNWQRTHQLTFNSGNPDSPTIADNTSPYTSGVGLIHVVSGTSGHDHGSGLYQLPSQPSFQAFQNRQYNGVWVADASSSGQTLTCYFKNTNDDVFDTFTYNK